MNILKKIFDNPIIKMIGKIISWIILIFLVFLAAILIYYVVSSKIYEVKGKKSEPFISLYTIISPSMEPNINVYDVVLTTKVDPKDIKEGDVITFISSSTLGEGLTITHRVKAVINTEDGVKFRTQGDNNPIPDSALVSPNNLLGKVALKIPYLGYIQFMLQSKSGWLFALLMPAIIVVIYDVIKVIKLSNVKQKINESILETERKNQEAEFKQNELKRSLKKKFINVKEVKPMVELVDNKQNKNINISKIKIENDDEKLTLPKKK